MILSALLLATAFTATVETQARDGRPVPDAAVRAEGLLDAAVDGVDQFAWGSTRVGYRPHLLLERGAALGAFQTGVAGIEARVGDGAVLSIGEEFSYGQLDLSALSAGAGAVPLTAPPVRFVDDLQSTATIRFAQSISRRLSWSAAGSYFYGGGTSADARAQLPRTHRPGLTGDVTYALAPTDLLALVTEARLSDSEIGALSNFADARLAWRHSFTRWTSAEAGAGLSWNWTRLSAPAQPVWGLLPTFQAALRSEEPIRGMRLWGSVEGSVAPTLDVITGTAYTRADAAADVSLIVEDFRIGARGGLSRVVQGVYEGSRTAMGEARVAVQLPSGAHLSAGLRAADLRPEGQGSFGAGLQWTVFVGAGWETRFAAPGRLVPSGPVGWE